MKKGPTSKLPSAYAEKLRDPRWQKKRLQILESAEWKCEDCSAEGSTLEVHHCLYIKGREPWDYSPSLLMALCKTCHGKRQAIELRCRERLHIILRECDPGELELFESFLGIMAYKSLTFRDVADTLFEYQQKESPEDAC